MTSPLADLTLERRGAIVIARVCGDIDMSNAKELRQELSRRTSNDALGLALDLTAVEYLDSAGIHLIHHLREDLRASGQTLALVIPPDSLIHATLRLTGLDWGEETVGSLDAAVARLQPAGEQERGGCRAG